MKILILTSRFPFPPNSGDKIRILHFIRFLAKKHAISLFSATDKKIPSSDIAELEKDVAECRIVRLSRLKSIINCFCGLFSAKPLQVHYYKSRHFARELRRIDENKQYDVLICHLLRTAEYARLVPAKTKILDLTDAMSLNYERLVLSRPVIRFSIKKWVQTLEYERIRKYEITAVHQFDKNLLISQVDKDYLSKFVPAAKIKVVPAAIDANYFSFSNGHYDPYNIIFIGKMSTVPNIDAVLFFVREILPRIEIKEPRIRFTIAGTEPGKSILDLVENHQVIVTGAVPDIRPFLRQAAVSVCPMRLGAGSKNKIIESMAIGTPVVSTTIGAEGLGVSKRSGVAICDTPRIFADEIIAIIGDGKERRRRAELGRQTIENDFLPETSLKHLQELLQME